MVTSVTSAVDPVHLGNAVGATATFDDADDGDAHAAVWNWGDSTTSSGLVSQLDNTVAGSHSYAEPGVYTVSVTITDPDGDTVANAGSGRYQFVVVYDPDGGSVTGGGWIDSPPGAYAANPLLTGKATFGFVAKYKPGKSVPDGDTEFQFKAGGLNFKSTAYEWLVTAGGTKAKFKGSGTINGAGNFGFMLTAKDGSPDTFRIKIWNHGAGDGVVYDNKMGSSDDGYDGTALGGGSKIHKS